MKCPKNSLKKHFFFRIFLRSILDVITHLEFVYYKAQNRYASFVYELHRSPNKLLIALSFAFGNLDV